MDSTKLLLTCITSVAVSFIAAYIADRVAPFKDKDVSPIQTAGDPPIQTAGDPPILDNQLHVPQQTGGSRVNHIVYADS